MTYINENELLALLGDPTKTDIQDKLYEQDEADKREFEIINSDISDEEAIMLNRDAIPYYA